MNFLQKRKNKKILGAELVITGGGTLLLTKLAEVFAPIGLVVYGLYRSLARKSYKDGIIFVVSCVALFVLFKLFTPLFWILYAVGGVIIIVGAIFIFSPKKEIKPDETAPQE